MMEIRIVTAKEGLALLKQGWPTVAVSLVGDDLRFPLPSFGPHHLTCISTISRKRWRAMLPRLKTSCDRLFCILPA
jgi:hypothetical protein